MVDDAQQSRLAGLKPRHKVLLLDAVFLLDFMRPSIWNMNFLPGGVCV